MSMFRIFTYLIVVVGLLSSCNQRSKKGNVSRYGSVTGLKKEHLEGYKKLHKEAWPGVLKMIEECNIQNYSIYLQRIEGKYYLFSYFEYTGNNFEADMKKMSADAITKEWWKMTDPCQIPLPEARQKGGIWTDMEEVFHTN